MYKKQKKDFKHRFYFKNIFLKNFYKNYSFFNSNKHLNILNTRIIFSKKIIFFFKKNFKKFFFNQRVFFRVNILPNYNISYKGKNPRMGRGAGFYSRSTIIHKPLKVFFKVSNISKNKNKKINLFFRKKIFFKSLSL